MKFFARIAGRWNPLRRQVILALPALPFTFPDASAAYRRVVETLNNVLNFKFDDSRVRTAAESAAGVTPVNYAYAPGTPERYGAVGDGVTDDTVAMENCIASNDALTFTAGKFYAVRTITFPLNGPHHVNFNGAWIRGIAKGPENCIVSLQMEGTTFIDYRVDGNFSQNYLCGTLWYNSSTNSQYNSFFGMKHRYLGGVQSSSGTTVRAMIYGALVGETSTGWAQSENQVYGWRTRGCQNPFYANHANGRIFFSQPIFVALDEEWPRTGSPFSFANARCLEVTNAGGLVYIDSGEIQFSGGVGQVYAAELQRCFIRDSSIETPVPIHVTGGLLRIRGGICQVTTDSGTAFTIAAGTTGLFKLEGVTAFRAAGSGSYSGSPFIDASATGRTATFTASVGGATSGTLTAAIANGTYNFIFSDGQARHVKVTGGTTVSWTRALASIPITSAQYDLFEVSLDNCETSEWRWSLLGGDVRLVKPGIGNNTVRYRNHRMHITAADSAVYILNTSPTDSMLDVVGFDRIGYSATGWQLTADYGSRNSLTATTSSGPFGYPANQLTLSTNGQAIATYGNPSSLANLQATALKVVPGERYWVSAWCNISSGGNGKLSARFFTAAGTNVGDVPIADSGSIPAGSWKFLEGPLTVPAGAAFMCPGGYAHLSNLEITDLRVRRAS